MNSPPQNARFVPGSAVTTQGQVQAGEQLVLTLDTLPGNATVELHYRVATDSLPSTPLVLRVPLAIVWDSGNLFSEQVVIINAEHLYLPVVANR